MKESELKRANELSKEIHNLKNAIECVEQHDPAHIRYDKGCAYYLSIHKQFPNTWDACKVLIACAQRRKLAKLEAEFAAIGKDNDQTTTKGGDA